MKSFICFILILSSILLTFPKDCHATHDPRFKKALERAKVVEVLRQLVEEWEDRRELKNGEK